MKTDKNNIFLYSLLIFATVLIGIVLGIWQVKPPRVNADSAYYPAYIRMMENIERLAAEPRNSGSVEIGRVRAEILADIAAMGLTATVEDASYTPSEYGDFRMRQSGTTRDAWWSWAGEAIAEEYGIHSFDDWFAYGAAENGADSLQNILVKLDAPGSERSIMFVSHYDSVSGSPGAADAMLPVCAMLEALRLLSQNGALNTDIYFLFTDGEEISLLGARQFINAHSALNIDMVINLEMRGNGGGLLLFETSPQSYRQMRTVLQSGAKPIGMSWAAAIYAMMPNDTDFTVFLDAGYEGVNFAAIEGVRHYHRPTDNFENLNRNTAWQYLLTTLALADYAANNNLDELQKPLQDAVYFPFFQLVLMPVWVSHIICAIACVFAVVVGALQLKQNQMKASFPTVLIGVFLLLSIGSAVWFAAGSYLFYIPLLALAVTSSLRKWTIPRNISRMLCGIIVLMLWIPVVYLVWISMMPRGL